MQRRLKLLSEEQRLALVTLLLETRNVNESKRRFQIEFPGDEPPHNYDKQTISSYRRTDQFNQDCKMVRLGGLSEFEDTVPLVQPFDQILLVAGNLQIIQDHIHNGDPSHSELVKLVAEARAGLKDLRALAETYGVGKDAAKKKDPFDEYLVRDRRGDFKSNEESLRALENIDLDKVQG